MSKSKVAAQQTGQMDQSRSMATQVVAMGIYEDAPQTSNEARMTKVSVTVDRGLLAFVDHYIQSHPQKSRSRVFDDALELWVQRIQEQADIACYAISSLTDEQKKEAEDWKAIQAEVAKHTW